MLRRVLRRLLTDERTHFLIFGALAAYLLLALVVSAFGCTTAAARPTTWSIIQPGTTTVMLPGFAVVIEVRQPTRPDGPLFWRISIVQRPAAAPPKPKQENRTAELHS